MSAASAARATSSSARTWPRVMPRNVPNSSVSAPPSTAWLSDRNRKPAARPDGLDGADHGRLVPCWRAVAARRARPMASAATRAGDVVAQRRRQAGERGAGGAGEGHHAQRVRGERLAAQHDVPADHPGQDGDDRPRLQRVDHERVREQRAEIVDGVGGEGRDHRRRRRWAQLWRWPWWWGASGWPTTTSRPSEVRSTSTWVPYSAVSVCAVMTSSTSPHSAWPPAR